MAEGQTGPLPAMRILSDRTGPAQHQVWGDVLRWGRILYAAPRSA